MTRLAAAATPAFLSVIAVAMMACGDNDARPGSPPTPSSTPTATSAPSASPTFTVTPTPRLLIGVEANPDAERGTVRITAWVRHEAGPPVQFVEGCTGSGLVSPIELELVDPPVRLLADEEEYPCGPPLLCPVVFRELSPGLPEGYLERTLDFNGTVWAPEDAPQDPRNGCDKDLANPKPLPRCTEMLLPPGQYTVRARFSYCSDEQEQVGGSVESVATFEWR